MPFLSHLDTRAYKPGESVLLNDFTVEFMLGNRRVRHTTKKGFITDFASIPWIVNWHPRFDVEGASRVASIPHDDFYSHHGRILIDVMSNDGVDVLRKDCEIQLTRNECDSIFRQLILDTGGDDFTRDMINARYTESEANLFYAGVQLGGWYYWRKRVSGIKSNYDFVPDSYFKT